MVCAANCRIRLEEPSVTNRVISPRIVDEPECLGEESGIAAMRGHGQHPPRDSTKHKALQNRRFPCQRAPRLATVPPVRDRREPATQHRVQDPPVFLNTSPSGSLRTAAAPPPTPPHRRRPMPWRWQAAASRNPVRRPAFPRVGGDSGAGRNSRASGLVNCLNPMGKMPSSSDWSRNYTATGQGGRVPSEAICKERIGSDSRCE